MTNELENVVKVAAAEIDTFRKSIERIKNTTNLSEDTRQMIVENYEHAILGIKAIAYRKLLETIEHSEAIDSNELGNDVTPGLAAHHFLYLETL
jgi:hypothetical protein